jgi:hypothetical protein
MPDEEILDKFSDVGMALGTAWLSGGNLDMSRERPGPEGSERLHGDGRRTQRLECQSADYFHWHQQFGWGAGGMISYGQIVGYGRSDDF